MGKDYAREDRIAEQMQRDLASLLRLEVKDPRVQNITLTAVEVSGDHSHAKVYYTTLAGSSKQLQQGLDKAAGFLRSKLSESMRLRVVPQLHFIYDESIERGSHLSQLIDQAIASDASLPKD